MDKGFSLFPKDVRMVCQLEFENGMCILDLYVREILALYLDSVLYCFGQIAWRLDRTLNGSSPTHSL